jgi:TP901 family phage tail tape measure protein
MSNPISFNDLFNPLGPGSAELEDFTKAVQGLSRNYKAFAKTLDADGERVKTVIGAIVAQASSMAQQVQSINLLNEKERVGMMALAAEAEKLKNERLRLEAVLLAQAKAQQVVNDATRQAQSAQRALQNELREAYAAQDTARIDKAAAAIKQYKGETLELSRAVRGANSELTAARGSYEALVLENAKLIASLRALGGGLENGSAEALALQKQIAANTQTLKTFDESILIFNRNVGNYKDGFGGLVQELAKLQTQQKGLSEDSQQYQALEQKRIGFLTAAQKAAANAGLSYEQANAKIESYTAAIQPTVNNLVRLEKAQQDVAKSAGVDSEEYRKLGFQIQSTKKELESIPAATEQAGAGFKNVRDQLGFTKEGLVGQLTQLGVGLIGVQAIFAGVGAAFTTDSEFQSALSSLSALTGATGEDLQFLADKAEELGPRVGKSATETLKAFELIGSAKPELLDSKEALAAFTEQVLLLSAASGDDLPAAAEALTGVMNQFQAPAEQATRYVNALAAGAKEGAATIPQSAAALKYFGVNAATANISVEKSVALIQLLAERSIKGEQAGTQLRNVLAKLASGAKETNPEMVGLSTALDNLGKKNLSTAQYTKLFGLENANTARVLVEGREKVEALTVAVTGTGVANEQAARQLDNVATAGNRFIATLKNVVINALDPLSRGLGRTLNEFSALLGKLSGATKSVQENTAATAANGLANQQTATTAQALLDRYQQLTAKGVKPAKDGKGELNLITLQLRDSLGESAAAIDKETGLLVLNEGATRNLIKQKLLLSNQAVSTLVLEADALKEQERQQKQSIKQQEADIVNREKLLGLTREQARANVDDYVNNSGFGELNEDVAKLSGATINLEGSRRKLAQTTADYNTKLEGLAKLNARAAYETGLLTSNTTAGAVAQKALGDAAADTDRILDRTAKARAADGRQDLQFQLADTERAIANIKKTQEEQSKLYADGQITQGVFKASVATTQDQINDLEYKGAIIRIGIARKERDEKLIAINDTATRAKRAKGISAAEVADINNAAAVEANTVRKAYKNAKKKVEADFSERIEVKPLEFKVAYNVESGEVAYNRAVNASYRLAEREAADTKAQFEAGKISRQAYEDELFAIRERAAQRAAQLRKDYPEDQLVVYQRSLDGIRNAESARGTELVGQLARREITQNEYAKRASQSRLKAANDALALDKQYHRDTLASQKEANDAALAEADRLTAERIAKIEKIGQYTQEAESAFFAIKGNLIDADIQRENDAYAQRSKVAGDNAALRTQIEEEHDKRLKKLNYDKAKAERDQAAISVAISTAVAVAKAIADYGLPYGLIPAAIALALGAVQEAVILSKPLPSYYKGRENGPAEFANLAEQGPELVGQPGTFRVVAKQGVGYLAAGDKVVTAPETRRILSENTILEGRIVERQVAQRLGYRDQQGTLSQSYSAAIVQPADFEQRIAQRQYSADMDRQTERLRVGQKAQQEAALAASRKSDARVVEELQQVRKAIEEQEYLRRGELNDIVGTRKKGNSRQQFLNNRYLGD